MPAYLAILGREPELSVAELEAVLGAAQVEVLSNDVARIKTDMPPAQLLPRLGGVLKIAAIVDSWPPSGSLHKTIGQQVNADWLRQQLTGDRLDFGFSLYGGRPADMQAIKATGLRLKKELRADGRAVRFVIDKTPQLSTVTVQRNGLVQHGREIIFVRDEQAVIAAVTQAVQDFRAYALRDRGRPAVDPKSGMLPPKLAQMMVNIARTKPTDVLLDPFCGSGTVLQEAALLGVKKIFGSDVSQKAARDSQENMRWFMKEFPTIHVDVEATKHDVREVTQHMDVVVTEPYLGQPLRGHETYDMLHRQVRELDALYLSAFEAWRRTINPGGRVVMVWPEFVHGQQPVSLTIDQRVQRLGFQPVPLLSQSAASRLHIPEATILRYSRDDAKVIRQIRLWEYKKERRGHIAPI